VAPEANQADVCLFKKKENLRAALALHFWYYDFARVHGALRGTPAMEAGLTDHIWALDELLA
jgi:hypothetical protein